MRHSRTIVIAALGVAAGVLAGPALRLDAAKPKPALDVAVAPFDVEARSEAQLFLALRNTGTGAATLALGDSVELRYETGTASSALTAAGSRLEAGELPAGVLLQSILGAANEPLGVKLFVQSAQTIEPGATLLVPLDFVAADRGIAPLTVDVLLGRGAGKFPRRIAAKVAKTAPRADAFYGDGADGALTITTTQAFPPLGSWTDVVIETGAVVTVPSGTTIRCTGTFENRGTIVVLAGTPGGGERFDDPEASFDAAKQHAPALLGIERGDALTAPSRPSVMSGAPSGQASSGAFGGTGLGARVYQLPLSHYRAGGGGGSGALGAIGGDGGGLFRVLARGTVTNAGTIVAAGTAPIVTRSAVVGGGGGGGGGGVVILASGTRVENTGAIDVRGGNGGLSDALGASGGAGGGGLVAFAAPQVGALGITLLSDGTTTQPGGTITPALWAGGGGGGACIGDGADGFGVSAAGVLDGIPDVARGESGPGQLVEIHADPRTVW